MNLLRTDQSTLTVDQWNLVSHLSNCFDHHSGLTVGEQYMSEQYNLPPRFRFKSASIIQLYGMLIDGTQSLYKNNGDFRSLCPDDRSILLHSTLPHMASLTTNFIGYKIQLMSYDAYFDAVEIMTNPQITTIARRLSLRLDFDLVILKLLLAIFSFSTFRCIGHMNNSSKNLTNIQEILRIQDTYVEVTWRYLLYKYDHQQAVKCFSDFIRCVFIMNDGLAISQEIEWFSGRVDSLEKKTEESFSLND